MNNKRKRATFEDADQEKNQISTNALIEPNTKRAKTELFLPTDCLCMIAQFVAPMKQMMHCLLVCKYWFRSMSRIFFLQCHARYASRQHLSKVIGEIQDCEMNELEYLYYENATWKPSLIRAAFPEDEATLQISDDEEADDEIIVPIGSALSRDSFQVQYELQQQFVTPEQYVEQVQAKRQCNVQVQQDALSLYKLIQYEKEQAELYVETTQEARRRDQGSHLVVSNFSGVAVFPGDEDDMFDEYLKEEFYGNMSLMSSVQRLTYRAGVKYWEPQIVMDSMELTKSLIRTLLEQIVISKYGEEAHEAASLPVEYKQTNEEYNTMWDFAAEKYNADGSADNVDTDVKVNAQDVADAVQAVLGVKLYTEICEKKSKENDPFANNAYVNDATDSTENATQSQQTEEDSSSIDETSSDEDDEEEDLKQIQSYTDLICNANQDEPEAIENQDDAAFIDDSEFDCLKSLDVSTLGTSLRDELLKISIRVHEQVYGKERTHAERLYLQNWYLHSNNVSRHIALDNDTYKDLPCNDETYTEAQQTEQDMQEDAAYYGNSLFDYFDSEDDDAAASLEESNAFQCRRMIREQSELAIHNWFSTKQEELEVCFNFCAQQQHRKHKTMTTQKNKIQLDLEEKKKRYPRGDISAGGVILKLSSAAPSSLEFLDKYDILLVKGARSVQGDNKYSVPKGHVEGTEDDLQAAYREIEEEANVKKEQLQFVQHLVSKVTRAEPIEFPRSICLFLFLFVDSQDNAMLVKPVDPAIVAVQWVPLRSVVEKQILLKDVLYDMLSAEWSKIEKLLC